MKISVKEVFLESLSLYRKKFFPLAGVAVLILLANNMTVMIAKYIYNLTHAFPDQYIWMWAAIISLILIGLALEPKLRITPLIMINSFFLGENLSFAEAFRKTKGKYWTVLLCELLLQLPSMLNRIFLIAHHYDFPGIPLSAITVINFAVSFCVSTLFFALYPMIAIEPKTSHYIKKSTMLIKGNFLTIFAITVIETVVLSAFTFYLPGVIWSAVLQQRYYSPVLDQIQFAISTIVKLIAFPLQSAISISVYRRLITKQDQTAAV